MTLELVITLRCDGKDIHLARETAHISADPTATQKHEAQRIAKVAIQLLAGEKVLSRSLEDHLNTALD